MVVAKRAAGPPAPARATSAQRVKGRPPTTSNNGDSVSGTVDGSDRMSANGDRLVSRHLHFIIYGSLCFLLRIYLVYPVPRFSASRMQAGDRIWWWMLL